MLKSIATRKGRLVNGLRTMANNGEPKMSGVHDRSLALKMLCFSAKLGFYPRLSIAAAARRFSELYKYRRADGSL
jgi:hypothetical protein